MTARDGISFDQAFEIVKKRYEENKMIYKKLYGFNFGEDLTVFDIIVNTDNLGADEVLSVASSLVKERYGAKTTTKS